MQLWQEAVIARFCMVVVGKRGMSSSRLSQASRPGQHHDGCEQPAYQPADCDHIGGRNYRLGGRLSWQYG